MTTILERRVAAAQATLDHFTGRPFVWGKCDCAIMAADVLRRLGRTTPLRSFGSYRTALSATRALKKKGFADLPAVLDDYGLLRIPYAAALPGDIVSTPGEDAWGDALAVDLGRGRYLGFARDVEGARAGVITLPVVNAAWRAV